MTPYGFTLTPTPEPHAERRRALLAAHPELKALFGHDSRTALVTPLLVAAQLLLAAAAGAHAWAVLPLAWLAGAPLTHWLAMAIHEAAHLLAARTRRGNTALALFANLPLVLPLAVSFGRYHLEHHRSLDVLGEDVDLPLAWEPRWVGRSRLRKLLWILVHPLIALVRSTTYAKAPTHGELLNVALIAAADALIVDAWGGAALAYLALSFLFAFGLHPIGAHFLHEHHAQGTAQETRSYYGPLNALALNVGHHHEHHDFPAIPGWRLPEVTRLVPGYRALAWHPSWVGVMWRFIMDREVLYGARVVRAARRAATTVARAGGSAVAPMRPRVAGRTTARAVEGTVQP
jgi:sphingolipid delta-4 desaturase